MSLIRKIFNPRRNASGQAIIEIALFGAVLIFLIGIILRTHLSYSFNLNHQVRAMKLALKQSYSSAVGSVPSSSRNSGSVLFIEDRLSPDFNKFSTIDRNPMVANGAGTMTNRLDYPIDFGEVDQNLPIMDLFVNGQHFPLTTAAYVFKIIYDPSYDKGKCPDDWVGAQHGQEFVRCLRQLAEWQASTPTFYTMAVNGTSQYNPSGGSFDLLRNDWDVFRQVTPADQSPLKDNVPPGLIRKYMGWQWQTVPGTGSGLSFGSDDAPNYPSLDVSGTLREQTVYAATQLNHETLMGILKDPRLTPYIINPSPGTGYSSGNGGYNLSLTQRLANDPTGHDFTSSRSCGTGELCITRNKLGGGNITGVVVLDYQLGDIDTSYDAASTPGPQPGLLQQMSIYSWVNASGRGNPGTYLQIKEGKLYNPETDAMVRSISSKDHVDLISRMFQLSNNTQRFCKTNPGGGFQVQPSIPDQGGVVPNPVEACGNCSKENIDKTCFDPISRVLFIRTLIGDTTVRKWFTNVTKGL